MLEHLRWIGKAEQAAADISFDYVLIYCACVLASCIFLCWCCIINLELYMLCPGWGPVRRFDCDGNEEMRINQLVLHEERGGGRKKRGMSKGDKSNGHFDFLAGALQDAGGHIAAHAGQYLQEDEEAGRPDWEYLPDDKRSYWAVLGMTKEAWNAHRWPSTTLRNWHLLGAKEKAAARKLGYDAQGWDSSLPGKSNQQKAHADSLYSGFQESYGTIGSCTWGYCESPYQWGEKKMDPRFGEVVVRHGFADTQWMRAQSASWAKDEPHFMKENGLSFPPISLQDESAQQVCHRMVYDPRGL